MLAGLHFEVDGLQQALAAFVRKAHVSECHFPTKRRGAHGARQVAHVGYPFQQFNHALPRRGSFAETTRVFGEVLHWPVGRLEISDEKVKIAHADLVGDDEPRAEPQHQRRGKRDDDIQRTFERG